MAVLTPNAVEVAVRGDLVGEECVNTMHFYNGLVEWDTDLLELLATAVGDTWVSDILPLQTAAYALVEVGARYLGASIGPVATVNYGLDPGGNSNPAEPNNVAACISFRSGLAGRAYRGRNYIGGLTESQVSTSILSAGLMTALVLAYNNIATAVATAIPGTQHVVVSTILNGAPRLVGLASAVQTYLFSDDSSDSMRNRLPGRGI